MSDASDLYAERERVLREHLATLPPPTERDRQLQRYSFAYGNLACTTNHRPNRAAFKALALADGWTDDEWETWADAREWWP